MHSWRVEGLYFIQERIGCVRFTYLIIGRIRQGRWRRSRRVWGVSWWRWGRGRGFPSVGPVRSSRPLPRRPSVWPSPCLSTRENQCHLLYHCHPLIESLPDKIIRTADLCQPGTGEEGGWGLALPPPFLCKDRHNTGLQNDDRNTFFGKDIQK